MIPTAGPRDETLRLARLHALQVLDTPPEAAFDALVAVAAAICRVPIALISLVDAERQWFKANHGLAGVTETPREVSFCARAFAGPDVLEIRDAASHPDFAWNPLVTGEPGIRFYAGAPIRLSDGHAVGALCVIDRAPGQLDDRQRDALRQLAVAASHALEGRRAEEAAKAAAEALRQSEARYRTLSEHAPVGVFHANARGECTYSNPRWQQIFGLTHEQSLGHGWAQTLHPADRKAVHLAWLLASEDARAFDREFRILRPDRKLRTVHARANPVRDAMGCLVGFVGSVEDVTRRKQLEGFLDRTGRLAGVGGWQLDLGTNVLTWSDQMRRIHEVAPDYEPMIEQAIEFHAPEARPIIAAAVQAAMERGTPWNLELPLVTANGRPIWVRTIGEVEIESGKAIRLIGAIKDISAVRTHSRALQEEHALRVQVQAHAAQTERLLRERSEMLDVLAHEVRQPLNNASAALQGAAAALGAVEDAAVAPRLARAQAVLATVLGGINNTLAVASLLARPDPIEREDSDIDTLIAVAIADLPANDRERVRVDRQTSLRTASMDMSLLRLALRNVLANAIAYSPAGTEVTLGLADSDEPLALLIDVADRGTGIPDELLPRLFERAAHRRRQTDPAALAPGNKPAHGLGLGLYIVRRVMELHGGSVSLLHNTPHGTTMRLTLVQPLGD